jgi:hypothetical protein
VDIHKRTGEEVTEMCQVIDRREMGAGGSTCCCGCLTPQRRLFSKKEQVDVLRNYAEELDKEIEGVRERIQELENK